MENDDKLDRLDERLTRLEIGGAKLDERINALTRNVNMLCCAVFSVLLLTVLALIYGALGERGFNAVRQTSREMTPIIANEEVRQ